MSSQDSCPVKHNSSANIGGCPVGGDDMKAPDAATGYNPAANDLSYNQYRQPDQVHNMSTVRAVSGIEKSTFTPGHQFTNVDRWVYPSGWIIVIRSTMHSYLPKSSSLTSHFATMLRTR